MFFPYYYVVTSVNSSGIESVYSNQITAVVPSRYRPANRCFYCMSRR